MRWHRLAVAVVALLPATARAQESYKVEAHKEAPPAGLSAAVKGVLGTGGYRFVDGQGKAYAEIWLRKAIPVAGKPSGPKGPVQFPFLAEGELLGVLRYSDEGRDYRDQSIAKGVYTLRYGLQPVNGDHLGVSVFRDYALLVPAAKDSSLSDIPEKKLHEQSAESAGTSHPATLLFLMAPEGSKGEPSAVHDAAKNLWGALLPFPLEIKGQSDTVTLPAQIILVGSAPA